MTDTMRIEISNLDGDQAAIKNLQKLLEEHDVSFSLEWQGEKQYSLVLWTTPEAFEEFLSNVLHHRV